MIIDIHTHCFPDEVAYKTIPILAENGGVNPSSDGTISGLKASMENANIQISVLQNIATKPRQTIPINRWAASVQSDSIISFGTIHPDFVDWKEEIEWLKKSDIKGIKFHPDYQSFFVDDEKMFPIYEKIFELGLIILFHAGLDIGLPEPYHCTPEKLKKVLTTFNGGKIIAAHMGGYKYWNDVEEYLLGRDIYLDTSYSYPDLEQDKMERIIKGHGVDKILFGSDSPWKDQKKEVQNIKSLNLNKEDFDMILYKNSQKLLERA